MAVARQPAPPGKAAVNVHRLRPGLRRWPDSRRRKHPATVSPVASRVLRVVQPGGVAAVARLSPADKGGAATARGSRCATVAPQSTLDQRRLFAPRERFHPSSQSANVQGNLGLLSLQGPDSNPGSGTPDPPCSRGISCPRGAARHSARRLISGPGMPRAALRPRGRRRGPGAHRGSTSGGHRRGRRKR